MIGQGENAHFKHFLLFPVFSELKEIGPTIFGLTEFIICWCFYFWQSRILRYGILYPPSVTVSTRVVIDFLAKD